jgi:hypothetical protein
MSIIYAQRLLTEGKKWLQHGQGKDMVKLPLCVMYFPGYKFKCDSCWIQLYSKIGRSIEKTVNI